MNVCELAQEYNIKKEHKEKLFKEYLEKKSKIVFYRNTEENRKKPTEEEMQGFCKVLICWIPHVTCQDDAVMPSVERKTTCPNFKYGEKCNNVTCKSYENYLAYLKAQDAYHKAWDELRNYPFVVKFVAFFQHKK